ncbi:hypothetical protein Hanom_Chr11g00970841 [Helianthus anomalus]
MACLCLYRAYCLKMLKKPLHLRLAPLTTYIRSEFPSKFHTCKFLFTLSIQS